MAKVSDVRVKRQRVAPTAAPPGAHEKWARFLTRTEAADLIGCTPVTLINYARRGMLTEYRGIREDKRGQVRPLILYDPVQLGRLPRKSYAPGRDAGECAARAFELFNLGTPLIEVVIEVRELPERVRQWHEEWKLGGGAEVTVTGIQHDHLVQLVGDFKGVAGLIAKTRALVAELAAAKKLAK